MDIRKKMHEDMIEAMRSKKNIERDVLRGVEGVIRNKDIELRRSGKEVSEDDIIQILSHQVKQRKESRKQFLLGGREDLAQKEEQEIGFLERYLPQRLDKDVIEYMVQASIEETNAVGMADMGKVMGVVMSKVRSQGIADGNEVREIVQRLLGAL